MQIDKNTEINKQMVVKVWFNCRKYGAIFYWLSCIYLRKAKELRFAVRNLKHELRLGLVTTYFLGARTPHAPRTHLHVLNVHKHIWLHTARLCVRTQVSNWFFVKNLHICYLKLINGNPGIRREAIEHGYQKLDTTRPMRHQRHNADQIENVGKYVGKIRKLKRNSKYFGGS